jgi:phospholipid/cholesterol/gamma-HCH transport system substrate-binding protein
LLLTLPTGCRPCRHKQKPSSLLLDSVVNSVNSVFSSEAKLNLQKSIRSIESTLNNLDKSTAKLDGIMNENSSRLERIFTNVESITSNLNQNQDEINTILSNLSAVSDSVKRGEHCWNVQAGK